MKLEFETVEGLPLIKQGDDIGQLVCERFSFRDGDILLVAHTVVSKSEGRVALLEDVEPSGLARRIAAAKDEDPRFIELVLRESAEVAEMRGLLLCRTRFGHVGPNAGLDRSNVEDGRTLLLPLDPKASARRIAERVKKVQGARVGVIVTDTCGRPFRRGQTGVALGVWGMPPMRDWRGLRDLYGRELEVTCEAVADELAAAANLLMGEAGGGTPAVVARGFSLQERRTGLPGCDGLYRPEDEDLVYGVLRGHYAADGGGRRAKTRKRDSGTSRSKNDL